MTNNIFSVTLAKRILGMLIIAIAAVGWAITNEAEKILEQSIFNQIKKQSIIYLYDLEEHYSLSYETLQPQQLEDFLTAQANLPDHFDFSIYQIFAFDLDGNIIASSHNSRKKMKQISPKFRQQLLNKHYVIEDKTELYTLKESGALVTDIIIPLEFQGEVIGGIELEIDIQKTLAVIQRLDDNLEESLFNTITLIISTLLIALWALTQWGLISPINHFKEVTKKIASGDLSVRSTWSSSDELGELSHRINDMADHIEELIQNQEKAYLQVLQTLAKALEARDPYTATHSSRVTRYSLKMASRLNLSSQQRETLKQGALMHDLGKIGIPDAILNKSSRLTDKEMEVMRSHPQKTAKILSPLSHMQEHAAIAAWHHERWDGNGYPDKLKGKEIPLLARIVSIADTWDAMTSDRVYRDSIPYTKALKILKQERDMGQFDPELLDIFVEIIRTDIKEWK